VYQGNLTPKQASTANNNANPAPSAAPTTLLFGPDLAIGSAVILMAADNSQNSFVVTVANVGDSDSPPTKLTLCMVSCQDFDVGPIAPGAVTKSFYVTGPFTDQPTSVLAQADSGNAISEANEGNNYFEETVTPVLPKRGGT
jgi:hypothetical protein